jgi:hypothetical protein
MLCAPGWRYDSGKGRSSIFVALNVSIPRGSSRVVASVERGCSTNVERTPTSAHFFSLHEERVCLIYCREERSLSPITTWRSRQEIESNGGPCEKQAIKMRHSRSEGLRKQARKDRPQGRAPSTFCFGCLFAMHGSHSELAFAFALIFAFNGRHNVTFARRVATTTVDRTIRSDNVAAL